MAKKRSMSKGLRNQLQASVRKSRRQTLWRMQYKKEGCVSCFVCGDPILKEEYATLEHIQPVSLGGTDDMDNLALSHRKCNQKRGNDPVERRDNETN